MIDPLQPTQKSDMEIISVPKEIALSIQEIVNLYSHQHKQSVIDLLENLIFDVKQEVDYSLSKKQLENQTLENHPSSLEVEIDDFNESEFLKSWDDIFNIQIYIDTDIFGELDPRPPALKEVDSININSETVIQHTEATEAYVESWKELAKSMDSFPDDLFTRLWTTVEIAKILECSPRILRRSRKEGNLPIKMKNLVLDCISHDGKRSLWFARPE